MDRCSKSTTATKLGHYFGPGTIKHHSGPPPTYLDYPYNKIYEDNDYFLLMNTFNCISKTNAVIVDRFHLGQVIYGKQYRNYPESMHVTELEEYLPFGSNVFLILLTDNISEVMKRDDGHSFEKSESEYTSTSEQFLTEFNLSKILNKLHINITQNGGFSEILPSIIKFVESKL